MATLRGVETLQRNLERLATALRTEQQAELQAFGQDAVAAIRADLSQPFGSIRPTYTHQAIPGRRPPPPGTRGVYSVRASSLRGTRLEQQAQLVPGGRHRLRDARGHAVTR